MNKVRRMMMREQTAAMPERIEEEDGILYGYFAGKKRELNREDFAERINEMFLRNYRCDIDWGNDESIEAFRRDAVQIGRFTVSKDLEDIRIVIGARWVE